MRYGVMLPYMVATDRAGLLGWARGAEERGFTTVTTGERITWPNLEQLVTLSAAAAVTERVRVVANIMIVPLHPVGLLAKRLASLDVLAEGRFVLAVGVGQREQDYGSAGATMERRWQRADEAIAELRRVWAGEPLVPGFDPIGPAPYSPGGPELWCGSRGPKAMRRAAAWGATGFTGFTLDGDRETVAAQAAAVHEAWADVGRDDRPYMLLNCFFALGADAAERLRRAGQAYFPPERREEVTAKLTVSSVDRVHEVIDNVAAAGFDELNFLPVTDDLAELDRLVEAIERSGAPLSG